MKFSFSTEVVDLNNQAPNRNKRESKYFWDELYQLIGAAGFEQIEVPYEPKWDFGGRSGIPRSMRSITVKYGDVASYMKKMSEIGIKGISCIHLDPSLFCSGMMEMYFGAAGHYASEAIGFAKEAGTPVVTLSATPCIYAVNKLMSGREGGRELFLEKTGELLAQLAGQAKEAGVKLCVKNEYWGLLRGAAVTDFLDSLDADICLDVDTANLQIAGVDVCSFIEKNAKRIGAVHFTDTSFTDDQEAYLQALPEFPAKAASKVFCDVGEGQMNLREIYSVLQSCGYQGDIILNCRHSYDIYRAILRSRAVADSIAAE